MRHLIHWPYGGEHQVNIEYYEGQKYGQYICKQRRIFYHMWQFQRNIVIWSITLLDSC